MSFPTFPATAPGRAGPAQTPVRALAVPLALWLALSGSGCRDDHARSARPDAAAGDSAAAAPATGGDEAASSVLAQRRVQSAVEPILAARLAGASGAAAALSAAGGRDWPLTGPGAGASVRCRVVPVASPPGAWSAAGQLAAPLAAVGAGILGRESLGQGAWRLDLGTRELPTHTLALVPPELVAAVRWSAAPDAAWRELAQGQGPIVALIIDDWGQNLGAPQRELLALPYPLTLAVLPGLPFSREVAGRATPLALPAAAAGAAATSPRAAAPRRALVSPVEVCLDPVAAIPGRREILVHLPMQPLDYPATEPGPGALLLGMGPDEVRRALERALAAVPGARGVNNHMGSAATADRPLMDALMAGLAERNLRFVDSLTSPHSVAYAAARDAGVPALRNRLFLDVETGDEAAITAALASLVDIARRTGRVVGIAHPHAATAAVLGREVPRYAAAGVRFVTVSEYLALEGPAPGRDAGHTRSGEVALGR